MSIHHTEKIQCREGSETELGGPAYSILEGELSNLPIEQLSFLCHQISEFHPNGLSQVWFIHQPIEGLQDVAGLAVRLPVIIADDRQANLSAVAHIRVVDPGSECH